MSTSAFLTAVFTSGETATPSDINVIVIEKVDPDNIGITVGIVFYVPYTKQPST